MRVPRTTCMSQNLMRLKKYWELLRFVDFFSQTKLFLRLLRRSREGYDADQTPYFTPPNQHFQKRFWFSKLFPKSLKTLVGVL